MEIFENFNLLLPIFVFIPLAVSAGISYVLTIRNYGAVVYNPPWKKVINSIVNETFFIFVFGIYIKEYINDKAWKEFILNLVLVVACILLMIFFKCLPQINELINNKKNLQSKNSAQRTKNNTTVSRGEGKNRYIPMSGYINAVLSYFSRISFAIYILITIILNLVIDADNLVTIATIRINDCWQIIANVVTIIAIAINGELIFELLTEQKAVPNDSKINKLKERLND